MEQPTLHTERLDLRRFHMEDAPAVCELAGDAAVARNTLNIPHPYTLDAADAWIASRPEALERGEAVTFAITRQAELIGAIGLTLEMDHDRAELGYWVGRPHWSQGFATEAAAVVLDWGFESLGLRRVHAHHFARNPPSGRVLQKLGMRHEGTLRRHIRKSHEHLDVECYGLLREEHRTGSAFRGGASDPSLPLLP
jgi:RimJ/RimL family protein N-acetyltransferase